MIFEREINVPGGWAWLDQPSTSYPIKQAKQIPPFSAVFVTYFRAANSSSLFYFTLKDQSTKK
ncbi:MAG: hypothetical protein KAQ75_07665 [Bacteroidales bacterium]|nr:hypothetical protein [Bacteroidales bacterium]